MEKEENKNNTSIERDQDSAKKTEKTDNNKSGTSSKLNFYFN